VILSSTIILCQDNNAGKQYSIIRTKLIIFLIYSITYIDGNWILKDGDGTKLSTNGTWLFVDELFKIYD
jgi:hypothetical protein